MIENFIKHDDGSWEPMLPIKMEGPNGELTLLPGIKFKKGFVYMGMDIAALLEEEEGLL